MPKRLPLDLYRPIPGDVTSREDLLKLIITSRALSTEAERLLYRSLDQTIALERWKALLNRLITCEQVAFHVQSISLPNISNGIDSGREIFSNLPDVLQHLPKLQKLGLESLSPPATRHIVDEVFRRNFPFQILTLSAPPSSFGALSPFLALQTGIETLLLADTTTQHPNFSPAHLRSLANLRADPTLINLLLPGRNIEHRCSLGAVKTINMGSRSDTVRSLSVWSAGVEDPLAAITRIGDLFPKLEYLGLFFFLVRLIFPSL